MRGQPPEPKCKLCNDTGEQRYWEGRWRDEKAENERLRAALERMMIGGNHIATYRTDRWPDYGATPDLAMTVLGLGREYDMWCCWNAIMCARDSVNQQKAGEK